MPNCIILRGLPGSGKSTLAYDIKRSRGWPDNSIVSADDYFDDDFGRYKFDKNKLGKAYEQCFNIFCGLVMNNRNVILDNTNTTKREYGKYVSYAKEMNYLVTILTVETDLTDEELAKRNVHGVPVETIARMRARLNANT